MVSDVSSVVSDYLFSRQAVRHDRGAGRAGSFVDGVPGGPRRRTWSGRRPGRSGAACWTSCSAPTRMAEVRRRDPGGLPGRLPGRRLRRTPSSTRSATSASIERRPRRRRRGGRREPDEPSDRATAGQSLAGRPCRRAVGRAAAGAPAGLAGAGPGRGPARRARLLAVGRCRRWPRWCCSPGCGALMLPAPSRWRLPAHRGRSRPGCCWPSAWPSSSGPGPTTRR